ncbi:family 2 glycosyl transferase [Flammeovirgaceae bacterium 311]|nr:family 2 glycosyl transferase [Flammeovirgaceae bacterium 311]
MLKVSEYKPLVSVLLPAYNTERFIKEAIESVLNQTYENFELIILDDKSTDNTKHVIEGYKDDRIKIFNNEINIGFLRSRNRLMRLAKGDYIAFQDADDVYSRFKLEKQLAAFAADRELGACGVQYQRISSTGEYLSNVSSYPTNYQSIRDKLPEDFSFWPTSIMVKKEVVEDVGLLEEYFDRIGSDDYYWCAKIALRHKLINLPEIHFYYRNNPDSFTSYRNTNLRKLASTYIVKEILRHEISTGEDLFSDKGLNKVKQIEKYIFDQKLPQKKLALWFSYHGKYLHSLKTMGSILFYNPVQEKSFYKDFLYILKKFVVSKAGIR